MAFSLVAFLGGTAVQAVASDKAEVTTIDCEKCHKCSDACGDECTKATACKAKCGAKASKGGTAAVSGKKGCSGYKAMCCKKGSEKACCKKKADKADNTDDTVM